MPESLLMPGVAAWVQLSKDETQWVLQQLQGLGEKKKIAQRIWAWPLHIRDLTVATAALTDVAVAVHRIAEGQPGSASREVALEAELRMIRSWFTEGMIAEIKAYKEANTIMESDLVALRAQAVASAAEMEAAASEVAARTTELALRVLQSPKLKADAERFR